MKPIKKIMMTVLVALFNWAYRAQAADYLSSLGITPDSCTAFCSSRGMINFNTKVGGLSNVSNYVVGNFYSCLCMTTAYYNAVMSCVSSKCENSTGTRKAYWTDSTNSSFCGNMTNIASHNSMLTANCRAGCNSGYYAHASTGWYACLSCIPGYYCPGVGPTSYSCPAGYYCAGYGLSTYTACSSGKYSSGGASYCSTCPESGLSATAATSINSCYVTSSFRFEDSVGEYMFTNNCFYS